MARSRKNTDTGDDDSEAEAPRLTTYRERPECVIGLESKESANVSAWTFYCNQLINKTIQAIQQYYKKNK